MADKEEKEKVVPTGSRPVDNSETSKNNAKNTEQGSEKQGPESQASGASQSEGSQKTTEGGEGKKAGEQKTGERSTEELLKTLENSQQEISQRLDSLTQPTEEGQAQQPDHDAQLNELDRMLKEGELNLDDYQSRQRNVMEQKFANQSSEIVDQKLQEQRMEQATEQYMQQNPDFQQYYNSREMQQIMQQNPLMDEVGAYESLKRQEAEQKNADLNQQLEQLKQERDNAVKNGAEVTDMPGKESGAALQHGEVETNKNLSPQEGMLTALRRARQATQ